MATTWKFSEEGTIFVAIGLQSETNYDLESSIYKSWHYRNEKVHQKAASSSTYYSSSVC